MNRILIKLLPWTIILLLIGYIVISYKLNSAGETKDSTIVTNNMIVEKVVQLGKLELTKFYIRDVMEQTDVRDWWLPNTKVMLVVAGEVAACVDLAKIDSTKILQFPTSLEITLPTPEICYFKIDHSQSKVYDVKNGWSTFEESKLIDKAYASAEQNIRKEALDMKILEHAKAQATVFLGPFLEQVSGKKVVVKFQ